MAAPVTGRVFVSITPPPEGFGLTEEMRAQIRRDAAMRYARLCRGRTKPAFCHAPGAIKAELEARGKTPQSKLIFDTFENATDFAMICESIGEPPQRVYQCNYTNAHLHLTRHGAG